VKVALALLHARYDLAGRTRYVDQAAQGEPVDELRAGGTVYVTAVLIVTGL
jgi:hypothetical protein